MFNVQLDAPFLQSGATDKTLFLQKYRFHMGKILELLQYE
jgi:hypothetical protein